MTPQSQPRKPRNSSKINLTISLVFHGLIVAALAYFAARQGLLGNQLKKLAVSMVKEKPPEKPKEPEKPKPEPPKIEPPKVAVTPKIEPAKVVAVPPPGTVVAPVAAPAAMEVPALDFGGGVLVNTNTDPVQIYQALVENTLRARWIRPDGMDDAEFKAELDLSVDSDGRLTNPVWEKHSPDKRWDASVNQAIAATKSMSLPPPPKFPSHFTVRFDVDAQKTEAIVP